MLFNVRPKKHRGEFFDREQELESILQALQRKEPLIVVTGPRLSGKTSLVNVAMAEMGVSYTYVGARSIYYNTQYLKEKPFVEEFIRNLSNPKIKTALEKHVFELNLGSVQIKSKKSPKNKLTDLLRHVDAISEDIFVVIIDDAHYLKFSNIRYDMIIAWAMDTLKNITFVLTGVNVELMRVLKFDDPRAPLFGRYYREISLTPFSKELAIRFLMQGFEECNLTLPQSEIVEAVDTLGGTPGWLVYYGKKRCDGYTHQESLNSMKELLKRSIGRELEYILSPSPKRYVAILEAIAWGMNSWSEIKKWVHINVGPITDTRLSRLLDNLVKMGYISKVNGKYDILDPLLKSVIREGFLENLSFKS